MRGRQLAVGLAVAAPLLVTTPALAAADGGGHQVKAARAATAKYKHLATARHHGYKRFKDVNGIACIAMPGMGAMGVHYVNGDLVANPALRVRHPEALVYRPTHHGLKLAALEYLVTRKAWKKTHTTRPELFGHRFNFTDAPNRYGLPPFYSLHAWVWFDNPAGTFKMWNPRVHCPGS
ncbi:MAG: hypothetical protein ACXVW2_08870 [Nocardioidaceae bacterium]